MKSCRIETISLLQMVFIFSVSRLMVEYSYMPSVCTWPATQDAWISDLLSGVFIIIFSIPNLFISSKFKGKSLIQYTEIVMGKIAGKAIGMYYIIYLIFLCGAVILFLADFLKSSIFIQTPLNVIIILIIVPCMYTAYKGAEAIGRAAVILGIIVFSMIILFAILNFTNMDFNNLLPIYADTGFVKIFQGGLNVGCRFCDTVIFFMYAQYLVKKAKITHALFICVAIFTFFYVLIGICTQTVLGVTLAKEINYPFYIFSQQVNVFNFIQRIEFLAVMGWLIIFFLKISTTLHAGAIGIAQVFNRKSYRPFVLLFGILLFASLLFSPLRNSPLLRIVGESVEYIIILFTAMTIVPTLVLIVYFFRHDKLKQQIKAD